MRWNPRIRNSKLWIYVRPIENDNALVVVAGCAYRTNLSKHKKIARTALNCYTCLHNRECAFGLSGRGRGGSRLPGMHSTQVIGREVVRLSTYYCAREAFCAIM